MVATRSSQGEEWVRAQVTLGYISSRPRRMAVRREARSAGVRGRAGLRTFGGTACSRARLSKEDEAGGGSEEAGRVEPRGARARRGGRAGGGGGGARGRGRARRFRGGRGSRVGGSGACRNRRAGGGSGGA